MELHDDGVRGQERLTAYDRPFFGRAGNLLLGPLNPAEVGDALRTLISRRWASWRGRAVESVIREALSPAAADLPWPEASSVGGWWNRAFDPEVHLIGADRAPVARKIWYAGSVKWLDQPFGTRELVELQRRAAGAWVRPRRDRPDQRVPYGLHGVSGYKPGALLATRGHRQRIRVNDGRLLQPGILVGHELGLELTCHWGG